MENIKFMEWPSVLRDNQAFKMISFEEWNESIYSYDGVLAVSDGLIEGGVACVLRGGSNAVAVLEMIKSIGAKSVKIFHIEERLPQLEDVFTSSVLAYANEHFDSVNVVWRKDATLWDLLEKIRENHSMVFLGAPLAPSEIPDFYERAKASFKGNVTIVRGAIRELEMDRQDPIMKWVKERTFEASDFSLPAILRGYKNKLGVRVAVVLPALNEEATVGNVIKMAKEVKNVGIIDDIILIDSASEDKTTDIGLSHGIPVYQHAEIRSDLGTYRGKGEAMFKSSFVTNADIMVWVDTDISTITPEFFYGLLGPMLSNPEIRFCKGYFSRPVHVGAAGVELGGGRVTEIMARPFINTFLPELSGFIQPLAGTVAIYREDFMKMRIPVNYGVEMAMLIQAVETFGIEATAQVNLGNVVHRSKDVMGLGEMAFQIMQVLGEMGAVKQGEQVNNVMRHVYSAHGRFEVASKRFNTVWREYE